MSNKIFIVHGHDEAAKLDMARTLEKAGFEAIILHEQPDAGRTIIEKFENYSDVSFAVILYTECDLGRDKEVPAGSEKYRARQQEQKKTNVRKFISVVKKYTDMTQLDATILREFVEQIRVSETYTTDEQQKRVKIREIEIVYNFIGAFDFEGAREQSQTAQDQNNAKVGAA